MCPSRTPPWSPICWSGSAAACRPPRSTARKPASTPPTIGLDLDEVHPAGVPIRLGAALREVEADVSARPVWARLRPVDGAGHVDTPLDWDPAQGGFDGELPGQAPGLYEIRVSAREVPGAGDLVLQR